MAYKSLMIDELSHAQLNMQHCIEGRSMKEIVETLIDEYVRSWNEKTNTSNQQSARGTKSTNTKS